MTPPADPSNRSTSSAPLPEAVGDDREDFDFLFGSSRVTNRRLADPLDPDSRTWEEFDAAAVASPVVHGLGNVDTFTADAGPGGERFQGLTLRLFDPQDLTWRIWWVSTRRPGQLDPPCPAGSPTATASF